MFLVKASCFKLLSVRIIDQPIPAYSKVFILDKQAVDWFNLKPRFDSFKPRET
jgi:hypothetical protein